MDLDVTGFLCRNAKALERARCLKAVEDGPGALGVKCYPSVVWEKLTLQEQQTLVSWVNTLLRDVKANIKRRIEEG